MLRESAAQEKEMATTAGALMLKRQRGDRSAHTPIKKSVAPITLTLATLRKTPAVAETPVTVLQVNHFKRFFDVVGASTLLLLSAPVMLVVAVLVRLSSPGPIILQQQRLTKGGKTFSMLKFRSMRSDAESESGPVLAQKNDNRITTIGRIIRLTRLDELPQLINVLRSEMSLVGPRPERPEIAAQLRKEIPHFDRRLEVKAGLTGLAQVEMGYSSCSSSYRRKVALDRLYVRHQSLMLDLWIAFRTVWVMLTGRGAR